MAAPTEFEDWQSRFGWLPGVGGGSLIPATQGMSNAEVAALWADARVLPVGTTMGDLYPDLFEDVPAVPQWPEVGA